MCPSEDEARTHRAPWEKPAPKSHVLPHVQEMSATAKSRHSGCWSVVVWGWGHGKCRVTACGDRGPWRGDEDVLKLTLAVAVRLREWAKS